MSFLEERVYLDAIDLRHLAVSLLEVGKLDITIKTRPRAEVLPDLSPLRLCRGALGLLCTLWMKLEGPPESIVSCASR